MIEFWLSGQGEREDERDGRFIDVVEHVIYAKGRNDQPEQLSLDLFVISS